MGTKPITSELHLCKTNTEFWEVGHAAPHSHSFSDVLIFHFLLSLQGVDGSRHLSSLPSLQQVSQPGHFPGNAHNYGSSSSRWSLVTTGVGSRGSYTDLSFFKWSSCFHNSKVTAVTIYNVSQVSSKDLFCWAEIQFIVSRNLKGRLLSSNLPEYSAWVLWGITSLTFHWYWWGRQVGKRNNASWYPG